MLNACRHPEPVPQSGAAQAFDWWVFQRAYPDGRLRSDRLFEAFREYRNFSLRDELPAWQSLGPKNVGGRTLCLAFHHDNPDIIFAGSASGGLWKTTTAGKGPEAWAPVATGYPVLAVSSIAIDPNNPNIMYIGTGEVYNYEAAYPGIVQRFTRGSYGIGILKSTDGGRSWRPSLDWTQTEQRGVWGIIINPENPRTLFAATTEGLLTSYDAGFTWRNAHHLRMAMDLELDPADTSRLFVAYGSLNSPDRGVYRSTDGGRSFQKLDQGIIDFYRGKTMLAISPSDPDVIYASVASQTASIGLYKSIDGGDNWELINTENVARYQGWYSHELAVHPDDPDRLLYVGIDAHRSSDGGMSLTQVSRWDLWEPGATPSVGGPEGPPRYAHADMHAVYYHPQDPDIIFLATDGGVFVSEDGGDTWAGRNGSYQSTQFYANFSSSATDPELAMGGLQDNATVIYRGEPAWQKVVGGDGMSTAISPIDDNILFASSQNLNLHRSEDRGQSFFELAIPSSKGERRAFSAPYELSPVHPNVIYAGAERLHLSRNRGESWSATSSAPIDPNNPILTIALSEQDEQLIYLSTAPLAGGTAKVWRSRDSGNSWTMLEGLPNRIATDIVLHPDDPAVVYITFAGFGTPHLYRSKDGGQSWEPLTNGLPDLPAGTLFIDPLNPEHLYLGNDLGVFVSFDEGANWQLHGRGMPEAAMVLHLSYSPANRRLRAATHGRGVYEVNLLEPGSTPPPPARLDIVVSPNPVRELLSFELKLPSPIRLSIDLYNAKGQLVRPLESHLRAGQSTTRSYDIGDLPAGGYFYRIRGSALDTGREFVETGKVLKI